MWACSLQVPIVAVFVFREVVVTFGKLDSLGISQFYSICATELCIQAKNLSYISGMWQTSFAKACTVGGTPPGSTTLAVCTRTLRLISI